MPKIFGNQQTAEVTAGKQLGCFPAFCHMPASNDVGNLPCPSVLTPTDDSSKKAQMVTALPVSLVHDEGEAIRLLQTLHRWLGKSRELSPQALKLCKRACKVPEGYQHQATTNTC